MRVAKNVSLVLSMCTECLGDSGIENIKKCGKIFYYKENEKGGELSEP
jgi:hypothetical protein